MHCFNCILSSYKLSIENYHAYILAFQLMLIASLCHIVLLIRFKCLITFRSCPSFSLVSLMSQKNLNIIVYSTDTVTLSVVLHRMMYIIELCHFKSQLHHILCIQQSFTRNRLVKVDQNRGCKVIIDICDDLFHIAHCTA